MSESTEEENPVDDSNKEETAVEDTIKEENPVEDTIKEENPVEDTIKKENPVEDTIKENEEVKIEVTTHDSVPEDEPNKTDETNKTEGSEVQHKSLLSCSKQWSENYESMEDDKAVDDKVLAEIHNDPKKEILWAAEKNEMETLRKLLDEDPSLCNAKDPDLYTPLHRASYNNHVEVIKVLLSYEADINAKTIDDWTPLHCACKWDSVEAASLLLQNGADVNAITKGKLTPLHLAASNPSGRRTLELLLWHPYVDPTIRNDAGDLAYDTAYRNSPFSALFEILDESINIY